MKIDQEKCAGCFNCAPYCPVNAIEYSGGISSINQELCLECGTCLRSDVCPTRAFYIQELRWPRTIRAAFSGTNYSGYSKVLEKNLEPRRGYEDAKYWGGGRGTSEMKTNEITNRYHHGEVGVGVELGRPGVGFYFKDLEYVAKKLVSHGVELEPDNPVTKLFDPETGEIKDEYKDIKNERALSAIIEFKVKQEKAVETINILQDVSKEIETVFSVDIINRCKDGTIPLKTVLDAAEIEVAINGKTCIGLGRIPE